MTTTYQEKAMTTCLPTCKNEVYAINGMTAEVGEINDKVAKWVRKGICRIDGNRLVWNTADEAEVAEYRKELAYELGDVRWFCSLLAQLLGYTDKDIEDMNIAKLRDRAVRGVIVGNGDNR
jgi:NTP pyrophosphatase (non-canonical NTP hydrolase)